MKIVGGMGSVGDFPIKAAAVNLDTADMTQLIAATSGLVKTLAITGGIGALGMVLLSALLADSQTQEDPRVPIAVLSGVSSDYSRSFIGICQNKTIDFVCDKQDFSVLLYRVNIIQESSGIFGHYGYEIRLIDGSYYKAEKLITNELRFFSLAGEQSLFTTTKRTENKWVRKEFIEQKSRLFGLIKYNKTYTKSVLEENELDKPLKFTVEGVTLKEVNMLRSRLKYAIEHNFDKIVQSIGRDVFDRYFQI